jgi:hypothetical protein
MCSILAGTIAMTSEIFKAFGINDSLLFNVLFIIFYLEFYFVNRKRKGEAFIVILTLPPPPPPLTKRKHKLTYTHTAKVIAG